MSVELTVGSYEMNHPLLNSGAFVGFYSQLSQMNVQMQQMLQMVGSGTMDFTKARVMAGRVREWSKSKSAELYQICKGENLSVLDYLEQEDPSPTSLVGNRLVPLDALERLSYELGVSLGMRVNQFYSGPAMILMPALVERWLEEGIVMGLGSAGIYSFIDEVDSPTAHPIAWEKAGAAGDAAKAPKTTAEGKELSAMGAHGLPITVIGYRDTDVNLGVFGRDLRIEYRVLRYSKLIQVRRIFQLIGLQLVYDDIGNIFSLIKNGDGVTGAPPARLIIAGGGGAGQLLHGALVKAISHMSPFRISHWVGSSDEIADFLSLAQFTGPNYRDETLRQIFSTDGPIVTPYGTLLAGSSTTADQLGFWDKNFGIVKAVSGPKMLIEANKVIENQWEELVVSDEHAFYKGPSDCSGYINYV